MPSVPILRTFADTSGGCHRWPEVRGLCRVAALAVLFVALMAPGLSGARILGEEEAVGLSLEGLLAVRVVSAEDYARQISGTLSSSSVITATDIREFGYRSLTDVLKSLPGLYVTNDRNYSYLASRGVGKVGDWNSRVLFLVDGYRVNENIYDGAYIGQDFLVDIDLIDRVEYVAGPAAALLYGNNAFFGVVNVVTRTGRQLNGADVAGGAGSGEARYARASFGRRFDSGLEMLLSASRFQSDGKEVDLPELGARSSGLDHERGDRFFGKISFGDFRIELAHAEREKGIPNASYGQVVNDQRSLTVDEQTLVDLVYERNFGDGSAIGARLFYGRYDYFGDYVYDLALEPPADLAVFHDVALGRWWGGEVRYIGDIPGGHRVLVGVDAQVNEARSQRAGYVGQVADFDDRRSGQAWGVHLHDEIAVGELLTFDVGGRYDRPVIGNGRFHPRVGGVYRWHPETTLKVLYGDASRPPNAFELYYDIGDGFLPNQNLDPEQIRTVELVIDHYASPSTRWLASVFRNDIRGLIDYAPQAGSDGEFSTDDDFFQFENAVDLVTQGIELRLEKSLANGGKVGASYTGQRTRDATGRAVENSPRNIAKFSWRQPLPWAGLRAGIEAQYVGTRNTYAGSRVPSGTLTNLNLAMTIRHNLDLSVKVGNVFDRTIVDPAAYFHAPIERIPQDGRSLYFYAAYRF